MLALVALAGFATRAEAPRALPPGELPHDRRLGPLQDLDGYFPFRPSATPEEWNQRAEQVRRQMRVALGLWPMPTRTPLNAVVYGRRDLGDYTVEKVHFESVPGFFVTGNLYRPKGKAGPFPGILSPHGHWTDGRFMDAGADAVRREIVQGAERFEDGGRSPLQSRCVQLARMGCVVFHYDMVGYADSVQIPYELAHGFAKQRPEMNTTEDWGLFSPQAETHLESVMGLQTWDSIRALDFLLSLEDVDPKRIGVTGASGGGTQTFVLCGIDPRPTVAFPAVMVSTAMQGGCTCENASLLRVDTGNVEFAALFAPKPLGMTAADDWTKEMPTKGFPELQQHYTMMGAPHEVMLKPFLHFGHNYNYVSRAAMYPWFNSHFHLGLREPIVEEDYHRLTRDELTVWDDAHPRPEGGPDFERKLLRELTDDSARQIEAAAASPDTFGGLVRGALDAMLGRDLSQAGAVAFEPKQTTNRGSYTESIGLLENRTYEEELPAVILRPNQWNRRFVVWVSGKGKAGLFKQEGRSESAPRAEVAKILESGSAVIGADLLYQGEFLAEGQPVTTTRTVKNPREAAAYTFGYNRALFAQRADDVLSVIAYCRSIQPKVERIDLVALDDAGPIAVAARAQCGSAIGRTAINTGGFRFGKLLAINDVNFLPGGAKYGDLPGMLALAAPGKLWIAGEGQNAPGLVQKIYAESQAADAVTMATESGSEAGQAAVSWLLTGD